MEDHETQEQNPEEQPAEQPENSEGEGSDDVVTIPRDKYNEMVEKLANETQSKANLVSEIKDLREQKQITEAERDELLEQVKQKSADPQEGDGDGSLTSERIAEITAQTVEKKLSEREKEEAKRNYEQALRQFQEENKEFHPDNDEAGLKMSALDKHLGMFNLAGRTSVSDFKEVFESAHKLMDKGSARPQEDQQQVPTGPTEGSNPPKAEEGVKLSSAEQKVVDQTFGGDKERYLKQKEKRPDYVAELLRWVQ